ncbi:MAG: CHAT domain-containing protein [Ginsengibacter sp.]
MLKIESPVEYQKIFNQAEIFRGSGQIAKAMEAYSSLLHYRLESEDGEQGLPFTINEFYIIDRLADISLLIGNKEAAKHLLKATAHVTTAVGKINMHIYVVTKLLFVNLHDGKLSSAIENAQSLSGIIGNLEIIQISATGLPVWENEIRFDKTCTLQEKADQLVCLYDALGALLLTLGRFAEASTMFERGILIGEKNPSPVVASRLLAIKILHAKTLFQKGEIQLAKKITTALKLDVQASESASGLLIHFLDLSSKIALAQGDMGKAYRLISETIDICQDLQLGLAEIHANFNLAQTKILLNQVNDAINILQDCLVKAERIGEMNLAFKIKRYLKVADNRKQTGISAINYISSKQTTQKEPPAKTEIGSVPQNDQRSEDYLNFFQEKALGFQLYLAENEPAKANEILDELALLVSKCDSELIHIRYQVLEFMQLYFTGGVLKGFPVEKILSFFKANQLLPELWQFRHLLSHTDLVAANELAAWQSENHHLLDTITNTLPPEMQGLYLLNKWTPNEEFLAGVSDRLLQLKQKSKQAAFLPYRWLQKWKLVKGLHVFQEELKRYKDHLARNIANGLQAGDYKFLMKHVGVLSRLWRRPKHTLAVSFLVLPDRVVIISRSFLKVRLHITFISRIELRAMVFSLRDQLYPEGKYRGLGIGKKPAAGVVDMDIQLRHLENILQLETIQKEHNINAKQVTFLADDVLHGFPFTLLTANGKMLLEDTAINISIDDEVLSQKRVRLFESNILLTGISKASEGLEALPAVLSEIIQIGKKLKDEKATLHILLDEEATFQKVEKKLSEVEIAHFSCHGKFDFCKPDQSGLVLANGRLFTLKEILSINDLSRIRLLVLSSCRGAEHFVLPGRWIIGLPETFTRAGVNNVLAFLWPVNDDFAAAFTSNFYENLKHHIPAEAFRLTVLSAKNKQMASLAFDYWHPKFWAGAILYQR